MGEFEQRQTEFNRLKRLPQRPSRQHLEDLLDHLDWLNSFGDVDGPLAGIAPMKIRNFAHPEKVWMPENCRTSLRRIDTLCSCVSSTASG